MAKQEQPKDNETQENIIPATPEKTATPTIDAKYFSEVSKYFHERKAALAKERETPSEDDLLYEQFLTEEQGQLTKIATQKRLEKMQPKDVCVYLGQPISDMSHSLHMLNPDLVISVLKEDQGKLEKTYLESRKVFMDSCKKIFPDTEIKAEASTINLEMRRINRINLASIENKLDDEMVSQRTMSVSELMRALKEDPKKVLEEIDGLLLTYGNTIRSRTFGRFSDFQTGDIADPELSDEGKANAAVLSESLYKLQLVRDELMEKIYGGKNVTPLEKNEIDRAGQRLD